jgi:hypothetical protein
MFASQLHMLLPSMLTRYILPMPVEHVVYSSARTFDQGRCLIPGLVAAASDPAQVLIRSPPGHQGVDPAGTCDHGTCVLKDCTCLIQQVAACTTGSTLGLYIARTPCEVVVTPASGRGIMLHAPDNKRLLQHYDPISGM